MLTQDQDVQDEMEEKKRTPATPVAKINVRADLFEESYSPEQYEQMMAMYEGTLQHIEEGEIVKSKVLRVTDTSVILDVGFKSEGAVSKDEFKDWKSLKEGDEVEVFLEHLEDNEGAVVWVLEYLRYRLNRCSHGDATTRVFQQILGQGLQPTCS